MTLSELTEAPTDASIFTEAHTAYMFTPELVILAVRAAGLDAGPMGGINAAAIDAEFFADTSLRTFMVVNIGHVSEDGAFPRNPRLGFDQAVTLA